MISPLRMITLLGVFSSQTACLLTGTDAVSGNFDDDTNIIAPGVEARSALSRNENPEIASDTVAAQIDGNTSFATDLYQYSKVQGDNRGKNLFYSPYSISVALAMLYAGARDSTESEMAATLHYLSQDLTHPAFNRIALDLATRGQNVDAESGADRFRLNVVNDAWGQIGYQFLPSYLDTLALNYGAGVRLVDFFQDSEGARQQINEYIEDNTESKITNLLPPNSVDASTTLVLTNAIYFKASWATAFSKESTRDADFQALDENAQTLAVTVPFMNGTMENAFYTSQAGYQAADLPYAGNDLSMLIIMPDADSYAATDDAIDVSFLDTVVSQLEPRALSVSLPKFTARQKLSLRTALTDLGMPTAFSSAADLSGIDGTTDLFVSDVLHQAFVSVDESGTEAAAATAVIVNRESDAAAAPASIVVDRPFFFAIRDRISGSILFAGRILNPAVEL